VAESRRRLLIAFPSWLANEIAGVIAEAVNAHAAGAGKIFHRHAGNFGEGLAGEKCLMGRHQHIGKREQTRQASPNELPDIDIHGL